MAPRTRSAQAEADAQAAAAGSASAPPAAASRAGRRKRPRGPKRQRAAEDADGGQAAGEPQPAEEVDLMSSLPDDVLLEVFGYLDNDELLLSRGVCARWSRLAMDHTAWQRRRLAVDWRNERLVQAVLRQAPCLASLDVSGCGWQLLQRDSLRVRCPVAKLEVAVDDYHVDLAVRALRRQGAFKKVRHLDVVLDQYERAEFRSFLRTLNAFQPATLTFHGGYKTRTGLAPDLAEATAASPSLTKLVYYSKEAAQPGTSQDAVWPDSVLQYFVSSHAASLQQVLLYLYDETSSAPGPDVPASLFAGCTRLRELLCPVLGDMPALLQHCPGLQSLELAPLDRPWGPAVGYLQGATQLQSLRICRDAHGHRIKGKLEAATLELLEALASSGRSQLRALYLSPADPPSQPAYWDRLAGVVSALLCLERLEAYVMCPLERTHMLPPLVFLQAAATRLRLLRLDVMLTCPGHPRGAAAAAAAAATVSDELAFLEELRRLMAQHRGLHVAGLRATCRAGKGPKSQSRMDRCPWWVRHAPPALHAVLKGEVFNVYSHEEPANPWDMCSEHIGPDRWLRLC